MSDEQLIELVRPYEYLYNTQHPKYMDAFRKNLAWEEISKKMKKPAKDCKEKWSKLRDLYRRALNRKKGKTGQCAKNIRKWRFEDEMNFLSNCYEGRSTLDSTRMSVDSELSNCDEYTESLESFSQEEEVDDEQVVQNVQDVENQEDQDLVNLVDQQDQLEQEMEATISKQKDKSKKKAQSKPKTKQSNTNKQTASAVLMQNLLESNFTSENPTENFFFNMGQTVKNFPPHVQAQIKREVFLLVNDMEIKLSNPE